MVEQCKGERGPAVGDLRNFTTALGSLSEALAIWDAAGWRFVSAKSAKIAGVRCVTVGVVYDPEEAL